MATVLFSEDRLSVLLVRRRDLPVWVLPGGGIDAGETPEEGALRECREETGLSVRILRKVAEYTPTLRRWTRFTHLYECAKTGGTLSTGKETVAVRFFSLRRLPEPLPPPFVRWIRDAEEGHPFVLRKKTEGVALSDLLRMAIRHPYLSLRFIGKKLRKTG
ncbi:MAG: NUDIX hydrolase [Simkaniaceae bacterium]|nr:NUDIX hydrolase [Simkaniaceae bacterium]